MLHDNNLIEMSLRLNRSEPLFRTIRELSGIGRRPRTRDDLRLRRNLPLSFMVLRQKPEQTFIFRILIAMNLDFHLQTYTLKTNIFLGHSSTLWIRKQPQRCTIKSRRR